MKRTILVIGMAVVISGFAGVPAFAAEAGSCATSFTSAMTTNVLVNGPLHTGGAGGLVSVGPFTPSTFVSGALGPTSTYVGCL